MAVFEGELLSHPRGEKLWIQLTASKIVWQPLKSRSHPIEIDIQEESILDNTSVSTHSSINIETISPTSSSLIDQQKRLLNESFLKLRDIVGCEVARGPDKRDCTCYLRIYSYPYRHTLFSKQLIRTRKEVLFACNKHITFKNNQQEIDRWKNHIRKFLKIPQLKQLLVLINPFGGAKKALEIFHLHAVSVLAEAGLQYVCLKTEYAGHARKLARELELGKWGGVVVVSGDGLVYEVLNGLMEHSNWKEALKTPLGVIPAGSGNALASSLLFQAGECCKKNTIQTSCLMLSKLTVREMDVVVVQMTDSIDNPSTSSQTNPPLLNTNTNDNSKSDSNPRIHNSKQVLSLLSVAWGIIADIDIESERFRVLGKARFTVGIVNRLINFRKYSGILSFLPVDSSFKSKFSSSSSSPSSPSSSSALSPSSKLSSSSSLQPSSSPQPSLSQPSLSQPSSSPPPPSSSSSPPSSSSLPPSSSSLTQNTHSLTNEDIINNNIPSNHTTNTSDTVNNNKNNNTDIINNNNKNNRNTHNNNEINIRDKNNNNLNEGEDENIITSFSGNRENYLETKDSDPKFKTTIQNDIPNTNSYLETPLLKPLSEKVPEEWVSVQGDDFVSVLALYQSHLSQDDLIAPSSRFDDSYIHLFIIKGTPSRKRMIKYFTSTENGLNIEADDPFTEMVKVKAFRLEPLDNKGIITVDGERVACGPIQGQKLDRFARIFTF